uniref:Tc1-like transposase DDE domain-containing protein n=1 Tax=Rhodnius prolixus TaxID=13249 RepID=T1I0V0_RHOPR
MGYQGGMCAKKGEDRSFGRKDYGDCLLGFARNNPHRLSGKGDILPVLLEDFPLQHRLDKYFQQDGCPAHNARVVRDYLDRNIHEKCLETHCPIQWPPRSLDLTQMDYFLWGYLKNKVYSNLNPVASVHDLKRRITLACLDLDFVTLSAATSKAWESRVLACLTVDCAQFEQIL